MGKLDSGSLVSALTSGLVLSTLAGRIVQVCIGSMIQYPLRPPSLRQTGAPSGDLLGPDGAHGLAFMVGPARIVRVV